MARKEKAPEETDPFTWVVIIGGTVMVFLAGLILWDHQRGTSIGLFTGGFVLIALSILLALIDTPLFPRLFVKSHVRQFKRTFRWIGPVSSDEQDGYLLVRNNGDAAVLTKEELLEIVKGWEKVAFRAIKEWESEREAIMRQCKGILKE